MSYLLAALPAAAGLCTAFRLTYSKHGATTNEEALAQRRPRSAAFMDGGRRGCFVLRTVLWLGKAAREAAGAAFMEKLWTVLSLDCRPPTTPALIEFEGLWS